MVQIIENGVYAGNWYDKYDSKNPIAKLLMQNFLRTIRDLLTPIKNDITSITEIGCGEGHLTNYLYSLNITDNIRGCDFSSQIIEIARSNAGNTPIEFYTKDVYDFDQQDQADLIICCEVLEHLQYPGKALDRIKQATNKYCLLSVPNEPIWRILNFCRGKYIKSYGNTPGHINHWNSSSFLKLLTNYFEVISVRKPLPWIMAICRK